jgi:hypothetical protein
MILATVEFPEDRAHAIDLHEDGWRLRDEKQWDGPALGRLIDRFASTSDYGPADGDPVARAAQDAAELLAGVVTFVRHPDEVPSDSVY